MKYNNSKNFKLALVALVLACGGCAEKKADDFSRKETNSYVLFDEGNKALLKSNYKIAEKYFEQIEREHPASDLASVAQIRRAYSLYELNKFDDAIIAIDEFIQQYPVDENIPYMLYLKALCYYDQILDLGRDQQITVKAIDSFDVLINRYPNSKYVKDALLKRDFAINSLAGKEMEVAYYYLNKNDLLAAINRYKVVIEYYQTSIFTPEALFRLVECYVGLGLDSEAKKYASVLGANYSDSYWYKKAYDLLKNGSHKTYKAKKWWHEIW